MSEPTFRTLSIFDVAKAKEFYLDFRGLRTHWEPRFAAGAHREITAKGYPFMRPGIERMPWRAKLMAVTGPFNNRLGFDEQPAPSDGDR